MKRVLCSMSFLWGMVCSGQTVYWDFSTATPTANTAGGLLVSRLSQGNNHGTTDLLSGSLPSFGYSNSSAGNNAEAAVWTGSLVTGNPGSTYFEFTLTPPAGSVFKLEAISFGARSTATGPVAYSLRTNLDAYTTDVVAGSFSNNSTWTLLSNSSLSLVSSEGMAISFRLYGYNGTGSTISNVPNWRIDDLALTVTVTEAGALPVQFGALKASQTFSGIKFQWSNLTETGVAQYRLERSCDGKEFDCVSELPAIKNDGSRADYQLTDPAPVDGNNFYRIKAVEKNNGFIYSDVIRINRSSTKLSLNLYPNPAPGNHIQLQIGNLPAGIYTIKIYNSSGELTHSQIIDHEGGSVSQTLLLNNLKTGIYLLEINGNTRLTKQFMVQ